MNAASLPKSLLPITGVIPLTETIFLWQPMAITAVLLVISVAIAIWSAPAEANAVAAQDMGIDVRAAAERIPPRQQPGEWLGTHRC